MPPQDLTDKGGGVEKKELLKINDTGQRVTGMEIPHHLAQDNHRGDNEGRPLKPKENRFQKGNSLIKAIFELLFGLFHLIVVWHS